LEKRAGAAFEAISLSRRVEPIPGEKQKAELAFQRRHARRSTCKTLHFPNITGDAGCAPKLAIEFMPAKLC
jgi:hypothetical protein